MKIAIGSDHGGYNLKEHIKKTFTEKGYEFIDFGCDDGVTSVDYPKFAFAAGEAVADGQCDLGILICSTGIGISIAANKIKGIRCAHCSDEYSAMMTRKHNNANILAMGEKVVGVWTAERMVENFLTTEFEGGRHERRVNLITEYENK